MATKKSTEILPPEWQKRLEQMAEIIQAQEQEISKLKKRGQSNENTTFTYLRLFQQFLLRAQTDNWLIERKYDTKNTLNYIDIDFVKYTDFVRDNLGYQDRRNFRDFLLDLNLINPDTFKAKHGKIVTGAGEDRKRIFRVPKEVFFRFIQDTPDIAC